MTAFIIYNQYKVLHRNGPAFRSVPQKWVTSKQFVWRLPPDVSDFMTVAKGGWGIELSKCANRATLSSGINPNPPIDFRWQVKLCWMYEVLSIEKALFSLEQWNYQKYVCLMWKVTESVFVCVSVCERELEREKRIFPHLLSHSIISCSVWLYVYLSVSLSFFLLSLFFLSSLIYAPIC